MPRNRTPSKTTVGTGLTQELGNGKLCETCGAENSFKRVKCEKCKAPLPDGKFERSRRMREQSLRRERQVALSSTLFRDKPIVAEDTDDTGDGPSTKAQQAASKNEKAGGGGRKRNGTKG